MTDRYIKSALKQANAVRKEFGKPPVEHLYKGNHSPTSCVLTNTIFDDDWDGGPSVVTLPTQVQVYGGGVSKIFPNNSWVSKFIDDFDLGKYPHLCSHEHAHESNGTIIPNEPEVQG